MAVGRTGIVVLLAATAMAAPAPGRQVVTVDPVRIADPENPVEVRVSFPATGRALPVVVFSHGNRLSRHDYRPLVTALTEAGFVVIQPDHPDASVNGFPPASDPSDGWRTRAMQLRAIRHLATIERAVPLLRGRIDRTRIAIAGHSFGGHSAALLMGLTVVDPASGRPSSFSEPAVRAAVLLAPPGGYGGLTDSWKVRAPYLKVDWMALHGPMLIISGENDDGPMTNAGPRWREEA